MSSNRPNNVKIGKQKRDKLFSRMKCPRMAKIKNIHSTERNRWVVKKCQVRFGSLASDLHVVNVTLVTGAVNDTGRCPGEGCQQHKFGQEKAPSECMRPRFRAMKQSKAHRFQSCRLSLRLVRYPFCAFSASNEAVRVCNKNE